MIGLHKGLLHKGMAILTFMLFFLVAGCTQEEMATRDLGMKDVISTEKDSKDVQTEKQEKEKLSIKVYYPDENGTKLVAEERTIEVSGDKYKATMESLLQGTKQEGLITIVPAKAKLRSVEVSKDGVATVDFTSAFVKRFTGGSTGEELLIGSIVNTLTEFPEVTSVRFLIEGEKVESIAGHMDTSRPQKRMEELLQ